MYYFLFSCKYTHFPTIPPTPTNLFSKKSLFFPIPMPKSQIIFVSLPLEKYKQHGQVVTRHIDPDTPDT